MLHLAIVFLVVGAPRGPVGLHNDRRRLVCGREVLCRSVPAAVRGVRDPGSRGSPEANLSRLVVEGGRWLVVGQWLVVEGLVETTCGCLLIANCQPRSIIEAVCRTAALSITAVLLVLASLPQAQGTAPVDPAHARHARRPAPLPTTVLNGQEFVALDDVASVFQVAVREDALAGGVTITYKGRTVVASTDQPMASVNGRVITLPAPVARAGRRLLVPIDFLPRALAPDLRRADRLRRPSRLLIVGDAARRPGRRRASMRRDRRRARPSRSRPRSSSARRRDAGRVLLRVEADALDMPRRRHAPAV